MAKLQTPMSTLTLNSGAKIPQLAYGVGTARVKSGKDDKLDTELVKLIVTATQQGYRHLDGAELYGNERELGQAVKESKVPREELFITTKVFKDLENIPSSLDDSLKKLGLEYVDLYLIHAPFVKAADDAEAAQKLQKYWGVMEEMLASGKTRAIGVSNFLQKHLETILTTAKVTPAVNQIEFNPYLQHGDLLQFHQSKGIVTCCYGPCAPVTKAKPGPLDDLLAQLAKKYYVNETEICLRYCFDKGAAAITTTSKEQRMSDYMRVVAFKLTPRELEDMDRLGAEKHFRAFFTTSYDANDRS